MIHRLPINDGTRWDKIIRKVADPTKRIMVALIVITVAIIAVPVCEAWEVQVTNSCDKQARVFVWGEHLFWQKIDSVSGYLKPGETKTCAMPGAICPVQISGVFIASFASGGEAVEFPRQIAIQAVCPAAGI
jgi:hypothetical protein